MNYLTHPNNYEIIERIKLYRKLNWIKKGESRKYLCYVKDDLNPIANFKLDILLEKYQNIKLKLSMLLSLLIVNTLLLYLIKC